MNGLAVSFGSRKSFSMFKTPIVILDRIIKSNRHLVRMFGVKLHLVAASVARGGRDLLTRSNIFGNDGYTTKPLTDIILTTVIIASTNLISLHLTS